MIRVLVADDHGVVREGIKRILDETLDLRVAGEVADGQGVYAKVRAEAWDVILLDISMPGRNGLEVLQHLKCIRPDLPVLVYSMHPGSQYAIRAFKAGARGYLSKDRLPRELVEAIRKVSRGGRYVSASLAEQLVVEMNRASDQPLHDSLSDREHQVLCLLGAGRAVTEIADELSLSPKTISTYRARILEKLQLNTTAELIHYAIRHELASYSS